jgi:hypothetical protein
MMTSQNMNDIGTSIHYRIEYQRDGDQYWHYEGSTSLEKEARDRVITLRKLKPAYAFRILELTRTIREIMLAKAIDLKDRQTSQDTQDSSNERYFSRPEKKDDPPNE